VEEYKITIDGKSKTGVYMIYYEGLTLNDLFVQAGGLNGFCLKRVEVNDNV
jgi:hypothetical protein